MAAPNPREMPDSYRRKRRRRRRRAGKEANGAGCSCGRPSSRRGPGPGPSLRTSFPGKFALVAGSASPPRVPPALLSPSGRRPGSWGRSRAPIRRVGTPCHPLRFSCRSFSCPKGRKGISACHSPPPTHLWTWRARQPHPPCPPGYGPARPNTGTHALSLSAFRTKPGPHTRTQQPGNEPRWWSKVTGQKVL